MRQLLICLGIVAIYSNCMAQYKYVSPIGNDTNSGLGSDMWRTIQHAMDSSKPGDTVIVFPGVYNEAVDLHVSGTASQWITFRGDVASGNTIIDGTGLNADNLLLISDRSYVHIEGFTIQNNIHNNAVGVFIHNAAHDISLRYCYIWQIYFSADTNAQVNANTNANPVLIYGDAVSSTRNIRIDRCGVLNCRTGYSEALSVDGNVDSFEITTNKIQSITNIGIAMEGHYGVSPNAATDQARNGICKGNDVSYCASAYAAAAGIYADGAKDCIIEGNYVGYCQYGIEVGCETVGKTSSGIIVRSNVIKNNTVSGIVFGGYDYPNGSGSVTGCRFYNNSCFNNGNELEVTYAQNCDVRNNIFYSPGANLLLDDAGNTLNNTFDYNCWYSNASTNTWQLNYGGVQYNSTTAYIAATGQDQHSVSDNPLCFATDTTHYVDLHIASFSPCVNRGDTSIIIYAGQLDIDGEPRFRNGGIDIGAYQATLNTGIDQMPFLQSFSIYPNPAHRQFNIFLNEVVKGTYAIQLYNIYGAQVYAANIHQGLNTLYCHSLSSGVYVYKITDSASVINTGHIVLE